MDLKGSDSAAAVAPAAEAGGLVSRFPRVSLGHFPTPLEAMSRLSRQLNGPRLFVKRDDCSGLAMGGNKVRQSEFLFGDALAHGADTIISSSAVQSNHLRVLAAASCRLGLACEIQREDRVPDRPEQYYRSGNVLLQDLFGAKVHHYAEGENDDAVDVILHQIADRVRLEGGNPYIIGVGIDNPPIPALAYVDAASEMLAQFADQGIDVDAIVVPSGSASTHAGTLVGLRALGSDIRVYGICVRRDTSSQAKRVWRRVREVAQMVGRPDIVSESDIWVTDACLGPGYGLATDGVIEAIRLAARTEGLLVDPVYSGKTMAGVIELVRNGTLPSDSTAVFLHSGGTPALFAYGDLF